LSRRLTNYLTNALAGFVIKQELVILAGHRLAELVAQGSHLSAFAVIHWAPPRMPQA
jgi:hypothetical protein